MCEILINTDYFESIPIKSKKKLGLKSTVASKPISEFHFIVCIILFNSLKDRFPSFPRGNCLDLQIQFILWAREKTQLFRWLSRVSFE